MPPPTWEAPDWVDASIRPTINRIITSYPPSFLLEPENGQIFTNRDSIKDKLMVYALSRGFCAVVTHSSSRYYSVECIHHGKETMNRRKLDEHVIRDENGEIVSNRRREVATTLQKDCSCKITATMTKEELWKIKVHSLEHSHPPVANPLEDYAANKKLSDKDRMINALLSENNDLRSSLSRLKEEAADLRGYKRQRMDNDHAEQKRQKRDMEKVPTDLLSIAQNLQQRLQEKVPKKRENGPKDLLTWLNQR